MQNLQPKIKAIQERYKGNQVCSTFSRNDFCHEELIYLVKKKRKSSCHLLSWLVILLGICNNVFFHASLRLSIKQSKGLYFVIETLVKNVDYLMFNSVLMCVSWHRATNIANFAPFCYFEDADLIFNLLTSAVANFFGHFMTFIVIFFSH